MEKEILKDTDRTVYFCFKMISCGNNAKITLKWFNIFNKVIKYKLTIIYWRLIPILVHIILIALAQVHWWEYIKAKYIYIDLSACNFM